MYNIKPQFIFIVNILFLAIDFKTNSILPPPSFGECSTLREPLLVVPSETPRTPSIKRYHRTIPKHVSNSEISEAVQINVDEYIQESTVKKASCQCPGIQHVPCLYGGSHLNSESNNIFLSTLTTKLNNIAHKQQLKSKPFSVSSSKIQTQSSNVDTQTFRRSKPNLLRLEAAHPSMLNSEKKISNNRNDTLARSQTNCDGVNRDSKSSLNNFTHNLSTEILDGKDDSLFSTNYPNQSIDVMQNIEPNPTLPPKLYKIVNPKVVQRENDSYYSNSKTHTITRPSENIQFSILNINKAALQSDLRHRNKSIKTLPRTESTHSDVDKAWKSPKVYHQQNANNTLPKNGKQNRGISITEVVNKVPAVIQLPHSQVSAFGSINSPSSSKMFAIHEKGQQMCKASSAFKEGIAIKLLNIAQNSEKLPQQTTSKNCANPKQHFLPNDASLDDEYLSECENCKTANGSRYYLDEQENEKTMETMTLQRKMPDTEYEEQQNYYRVSSTLPTNTNKKQS